MLVYLWWGLGHKGSTNSLKYVKYFYYLEFFIIKTVKYEDKCIQTAVFDNT